MDGAVAGAGGVADWRLAGLGLAARVGGLGFVFWVMLVCARGWSVAAFVILNLVTRCGLIVVGGKILHEIEMRIGFTKRQKALLVTLGLVVLANVAWFYWSKQSAETEFKLTSTNFAMMVDVSEIEKMPYFDVADDGWTLNGQDLQTLESLVVDHADHHARTGSLILFRLPPTASTENFQRALAAVANQGICYFGVLVDGSGSPQDIGYEIAIHQILQVQNEQDDQIICVDRHTPQ